MDIIGGFGNMNDIKVTVTDVGGTYRDVANAARTTINMAEGDKEISEEYMYKMYKCEHSPIRLRQFRIVIENLIQLLLTLLFH